MSATLPYLESERHFQLYEPYLKLIVERWPTVTTITPAPPHASVETLSTRIRMAIKSLRANQWPCSINMVKFFQCCDEITISTKVSPGKVVAGPREAFVRAPDYKPLVESDDESETQRIPKINLVEPDEQLVRAVCCLHHHRILSEPSHIVSEGDLNFLTNLYDISLSHVGNDWTIL